MLRELVLGAGVVRKEDLVLRVWSVPEYHPLRDDKRLQVTIRRLRERLSAAGGAESLVVTESGGYRLACAARLVE